MTTTGQKALRPTQTLPVRLGKALRSAYLRYNKANEKRAEDRDDVALHLASLAQAGRDAGWPIATLASHCGRTPEEAISPERLRQIIATRLAKAENEGTALPEVPEFPPRLRVVKEVPPPKNTRRALTDHEASELARLAPLAKQNTGSRPLDHPARAASVEFSDLIKALHDDNVTWGEMTGPTGLTIAGLRMRAARHGYGKGAPPSIAPYRGIALHPQAKPAVEPIATKAPAKKTASKSAASRPATRRPAAGPAARPGRTTAAKTAAAAEKPASTRKVTAAKTTAARPATKKVAATKPAAKAPAKVPVKTSAPAKATSTRTATKVAVSKQTPKITAAAKTPVKATDKAGTKRVASKVAATRPARATAAKKAVRPAAEEAAPAKKTASRSRRVA